MPDEVRTKRNANRSTHSKYEKMPVLSASLYKLGLFKVAESTAASSRYLLCGAAVGIPLGAYLIRTSRCRDFPSDMHEL